MSQVVYAGVKVLSLGLLFTSASLAQFSDPPPMPVTYPFSFSGTVGGLPVDVAATVEISTNFTTVQLFNNLPNPTSASQLISRFDFNVGGAGFIITPINNEFIAQHTGRTVNSPASGGYSDQLLPSNQLWNVGSQSGPGFLTNTFFLTTIPNGPSGMVIGAPGSNNAYSSANASIAGAGQNNPFTLTGAIFPIRTINFVPVQTFVTGATFYFGTSGEFSAVARSGVPDGGATGILMGLALFALAGVKRFVK